MNAHKAYCTRCGVFGPVAGYCGLCEQCMTTWMAAHARGLSRTGRKTS